MFVIRINKVAELCLTIVCIILIINLSIFIKRASNEFSKFDTVEYQYKDFSNKDIELAMKYHGTPSCVISEKEVYFVRKNKKHNLFTDKAIEYIIEYKKKSLTE